MIRRTNTAAGAYLLDRAAKLAKSIVARFGSKTEVFDGCLVRGRRTNDILVAEVIEPPAWLVVVGSVALDVPTTVSDSLILQLASGRDGLTAPGAPTVVDPTESPTVVRPQAVFRVGPQPVGQFSYATVTGETAEPVPATGVVRGYNRMFATQQFPVNATAFVDRSARVQYQALLLAPQLFRSQFVDGARVDTPLSSSPVASWSLFISDQFLRDLGALPFAMRVSPPPYDPTSTAATQFAQAQAPWQDLVATRYIEDGVDTYQITLWSQVVFDMVSDNDRFGARGLWVATFQVAAGQVQLVNQFVVDTRLDPNTLRRPRRGALAHEYNAHLRVCGVALNSGTAIVLDPFQVISDGLASGAVGPTARYMSVDLHWVNRAGSRVRSQTIRDAFRVNSGPHDMRAPIGMATDGEEAVAVVFSTAFTNQPSNLDVVVVNETTASVVLSIDAPFFQCMAATPGSRLTTGQLDNDYWGTVGAGGSQVCYIGNGKYLFYVSSVVQSVGITAGNWASAVYDRATNTATLTGVVDPTILPVSTPVALGQPFCARQEVVRPDGTVAQKAIVLATRGGYGQLAGVPTTEEGETWISYDSGETWNKLADYGSPAGVVYCGNMLQPR